MTAEEYDELDRAIAAALGWTEIDRRYGVPPGEHGPRLVPNYSTSNAYAMDALVSLGQSFEIDYCVDLDVEKRWYVRIYRATGSGHGSDLSVAICRAVLDYKQVIADWE